jgi:2-C-methyl-D-erythritol 2,4-cyclodiphosphate synthase
VLEPSQPQRTAVADQRVGFGYDAHRFGGPGPVILCGVPVDHDSGVLATSDGDVAAHAVCDAVLGAAAIGDLGTFFPSNDPQWHGVRSMDLVAKCVTMVFDRGYDISNVDLTIVAKNVMVAPHRDDMKAELARAVRLAPMNVSVKATTTDGLGWIGAGEGLAAFAVVNLTR